MSSGEEDGRARFAIRRAMAADVHDVLLLERASSTAPHWPEGAYRAMLGLADGDPAGGTRRVLLVADGIGGLAGFAVGRVAGLRGAAEAEIESVLVRAGDRRQGLGRLLCHETMLWCKAQGAQEVLLEVRAGSEGAIRLYRRLGFVAFARRPGYYSQPADDAVLMRCALQGLRTGLLDV